MARHQVWDQSGKLMVDEEMGEMEIEETLEEKEMAVLKARVTALEKKVETR